MAKIKTFSSKKIPTANASPLRRGPKKKDNPIMDHVVSFRLHKKEMDGLCRLAKASGELISPSNFVRKKVLEWL